MVKETVLPVSKELCCGYSACTAKCPKYALSMKEDDERFLSSALDEEICIDWSLCKKFKPCEK